MSHSRVVKGLFPILCLLQLLVGSLICEIGMVQTYSFWVDTFNDGDHNGWSVEKGIFEVINGSLVGLGVPGFPNAATIYHSSSGAYGTWSFEIKGYTPSVWFIASSPNTHNVTGYRFGRVLDGNISSFGLYRAINGQETRLAHNLTSSDPASHRIRIERDLTGLFSITANGTEVISTTDTTVTTSVHFVFGVFSPGGALDNVIVESILLEAPSEITIPPPEGFNPVLLAVISIIIVISAVSIAEIRRRRS